ncbi:MAG TPA: hypothetical protein VI384_04420 [Candidatus Dormibacteraeota bacterium]
MDFKNMLGRKLKTVSLDASKSRITFDFADGFSRSFGVEGDCCSTSWIEHLEMPGDIDGATLLSVEDSAPITQDHPEHDDENGGDSIGVYNTVFRTDRGDIVLEYRNSSNGYYGGYLVDR